MRSRRWSPRWIAASASTIVSELISSTNDVTDVNGMFEQVVGRRAAEELGVAAAVEEVRRDERAEEQRLRRRGTARSPSFGLLTPVFVVGVVDAVLGVRRRSAGLVGAHDCLGHQCARAVDARACSRRRLGRRLDRPRDEAEEHDRDADAGEDTSS